MTDLDMRRRIAESLRKQAQAESEHAADLEKRGFVSESQWATRRAEWLRVEAAIQEAGL